MNHTSRKRGEHRTDDEVQKEIDNTVRITNAWENFVKVRRGWKSSGKPLEELLDYSSKLMSLLGEAGSVYNFRQDLIEQNLSNIVEGLKTVGIKMKTATEEITPSPNNEESEPKGPSLEEQKQKLMKQLEDLIKTEMEMLVGLAMKDPKCYQIWFHRKWMFVKIWEVETKLKIEGTISKKCVAMDIKICDKFLLKDERNFHAWNYRCFLIKYQMDRFPNEALATVEKELSFLQSKLESNFSNYSAIHFKTKYLILREQLKNPESFSKLEDDKIPIPWEIVKTEVNFASEGLFIAPYEQSLWIYLAWLLSRRKLWAVQKVTSSLQSLNCQKAVS